MPEEAFDEPSPTRPVHPAYRALLTAARAAGWLGGRVLPGVGFERRPEGLAFRLPLSGLIAGLGNLIALWLVATLYLQFLVGLLQFEYYGPITNIEETAYSYNIGRNFAQYGFLQTVFLQDVGHSPFKEDHPYTYNHQPPGLDIITGAVLTLFPDNFRLLRFLFSLTFLSGMVVFFAFANVILKRYGIPLAGYTILFFSGWVIMQGFDKQTSYYHPLMLFAPFLLFYYAQRKNRRGWLYLALAMTLAMSFMADYIVVAAVMFAWMLLPLTRVLNVSWRQAALFVGMIVLGVVLHLVQNLIFLGWTVFVQELAVTIGNRAVGYPTVEQVRDFYEQIGVVHHGARPPEPGVLMRQLMRQLDFELSLPPGAVWRVLTLGILAIALQVGPRVRLIRKFGTIVLPRGPWLEEAGFVLRLWVWILATVTLPNLIFPAYNQEVVLSGSGVPLYFKAIGTVALFALAVRGILAMIPRSWSFSAPWATRLHSLAAGDPTRVDEALRTWQRLARSMVGVVLLLGLLVFAGLLLLAGIWGVRTNAVPREARIAFYFMGLSVFVLLGFVIWPYFRRASASALDGIREATGRSTFEARDAWVVTLRWLSERRVVEWVALRLLAVAAIVATVIVGGGLLLQAGSSRLAELRQIEGAVADARFTKLADLKGFPGALFMTNINTPIIGFFTRAPGYGVCELDSLIGENAPNTQVCRVDFQRRHAYWATQKPRYFYFFKAPELFPGFASCLPGGTLQSVTRGGDDCVTQSHERLASRADKIFDNGIFEVFDLTRPPPPASSIDPSLAPPQLSVTRTFPNAVLLGWPTTTERGIQYRVELKREPADDFQQVSPVGSEDIGILVDRLDAATRYFLRARACSDRGCSPYVYLDAKTGS